MKNPKIYFIVLVSLFVLNIFINSSVSFADGAPFPPTIQIRNAVLNGTPITFDCGLFANFPANSLLEFDVLIDVYNEHASVSNSFNPSSPPGSPTFTPPFPTNVIQGLHVYHFSWISPAQYNGFLNFYVNDGINPPVTCILNFDISLPVELSSFVSEVHHNDVTLNWSTSSEINNSGFDLERSMINGEWSKVYFVNGKGTTSSPSNYEFTDRNLSTGKYNYRLKQIDFNGNFEYFNLANEVNIGAPDKFSLSQNYPNPFNPATKISYDLPFDGKVSLTIFDITGKEVMNLIKENKSSGYYEAVVNASNLSSGVYFYRLILEGNGNNFTATKRMMVMK
ncbi:MAG: hypothetical protein HGGPFJEG_02850 [Ignavibacteria bacterium]|nr:hypothetical protein [Ignavibacteria bacterium]